MRLNRHCITAVLPGLMTAITLVGCGGDDPKLDSRLIGKAWIATDARSSDGQQILSVTNQIGAQNPFWFQMGLETLDLYEGCNKRTGTHSYSGDQIFLDVNTTFSFTVFCNFPEYRDQVLNLQNTGATWRFLDGSSETLELSGADGDIYTFRAASNDFCPVAGMLSAFKPC